MSHELRTPLTAILGFSELLAERFPTTLSSEQWQSVRNAPDVGRERLGVSNGARDISKTGRIEPRPEVARVGALLGEIASAEPEDHRCAS